MTIPAPIGAGYTEDKAMSKLKNKRGTSKGEFVNKAIDIRQNTAEFLARLSARYARLYAQDIQHLANAVSIYTEEAQSMRPTDATRYELRKGYLLKARAALNALDNMMLDIYTVLMKNPLGAFDDLKKKAEKRVEDVDGYRIHQQCSAEAVKRLDHMAETLGCLIEDEEALINGVLNSDKKTFAAAKAEQK